MSLLTYQINGMFYRTQTLGQHECPIFVWVGSFLIRYFFNILFQEKKLENIGLIFHTCLT